MKAQDTFDILDEQDKRAVQALTRIYGDDVDNLLQNLNWLSTRIAVLSGVAAEDWARGIETCWNTVADVMEGGNPPLVKKH